MLAVPSRLKSALRDASRSGPTPTAARVLRFDFHWTTHGWRISEVNSDVPGGFTEASAFPALFAARVPNTLATGDVGRALATAVAAAVEGADVRVPAIGLLAAPGIMEDQQVVAYLAQRLEEQGLEACCARPEQLEWDDHRAVLRCGSARVPLAALIRFYQAEWLAGLPSDCRRFFFSGGRTPVVNPGTALLTESKRFPLVWDALETPLPLWRRLLPESRDPRSSPWLSDDEWLVKGAFCNTGDAVVARRWATAAQCRSVCRDVWLRPGRWVAQRCFETISLATPTGALYPCVGVYTVNGRAAGAYARLSVGPVVDYRAVDVALLIEREGSYARSSAVTGCR